MAVGNTERDLPEFDKVLWKPWQYEEAALSGEPTFIRAMRLSPCPTFTTLDLLLDKTEEHFTILEDIGIKPPPFKWGLIREELIPEHHRWEFKDHGTGLLPQGFCFAAEVAVVTPAEEPRTPQIFSDVFRRYTTHLRTAGDPLRLEDFDPSDIVRGNIPLELREDSTQEREWFIDFEPRLGNSGLV